VCNYSSNLALSLAAQFSKLAKGLHDSQAAFMKRGNSNHPYKIDKETDPKASCTAPEKSNASSNEFINKDSVVEAANEATADETRQVLLEGRRQEEAEKRVAALEEDDAAKASTLDDSEEDIFKKTFSGKAKHRTTPTKTNRAEENRKAKKRIAAQERYEAEADMDSEEDISKETFSRTAKHMTTSCEEGIFEGKFSRNRKQRMVTMKTDKATTRNRKKGQRPTSIDQTKDVFVRKILPKLAKDTIALSRMMSFEDETNIALRLGVPCCLIFQDNVVQKPYAENDLTKLRSKPNYVLLASDKVNGKRLRDSIFKDNSD
jgi:hypothetical protein